MSHFDDSPHEMHGNSLTPETADQLLDGEILSPEFAELAAMVGEVRQTVSSTPTPEVRGALAEFVGLGTNESPAVPTTQPRRRSVIAEVMTFAGTVGGKLLIGGSLAAASVTGAQATGLVDLPLLTDEPTTVVTTDAVTADEAPAELPLEAPVDEVPEVKIPEAEKPAVVEEVPEAEEEKPVEEKPVEAPKPAEEKAEEKPVEEPKPVEEEEKPAENKEEPTNDEAIAALQAQLTIDKEANYVLAADLIAPIAAEKKLLVEALNVVLAPLEQARNDAKAPLYAELETTEDPARKTEIEAELGAIWDQWIIDRDAAAAAANPAIAVLEAQIKTIETNRDVEIERLLTVYQAAVDALN